MKVLMTADPLGGVWTYTIDLVRAFEPHRIDVALVSFGKALTDTQRAQAEELGNVRLFESCYRLEWMDEPWSDIRRGGEWLLELETAFRPDIVHLNELARGALPWRAPVVVVGHSCVLSWWCAVIGGEAPGRFERYRREVRTGLRSADMVVAPTHTMLNQLRQLYGPLPSAAVVRNGRDAGLYEPAVKQSFILAAGRIWDEGKNLKILSRVAPGLPWPIVVAGDARGVSGSRKHLRGVRQVGLLELRSLARLFNAAAVYALPARYEPFGLSALEAAHAGCALVLGDIPSLREVWDGAALFVSPDDANGLRDALLGLIRDAESRRHWAEAAVERARARTPECMARAYIEIYENLVATRSHRCLGPETGPSTQTGEVVRCV